MYKNHSKSNDQNSMKILTLIQEYLGANVKYRAHIDFVQYLISNSLSTIKQIN